MANRANRFARKASSFGHAGGFKVSVLPSIKLRAANHRFFQSRGEFVARNISRAGSTGGVGSPHAMRPAA